MRGAGGWEALMGLLLLAGGRGHESPLATTVTSSPDVCASKTINYITHTLPQQCLRTSWTSASLISTQTDLVPPDTATAIQNPEPAVQSSADPEQPEDQKENGDRKDEVAKEEENDSQDLATSSFMSFEEWKEMMLHKSGQDPNDPRPRKQRESKGEGSTGGPNGDLDTFGDDGEISLDFDALSDKISELTASNENGERSQASKDSVEEPVLYDDGKYQYYRSKDAGKTCKERFSYSSFDAGATVLKTSPGAKNAKALLVENKDSYMLLECATANKFVIVELSDDILVDTVVLANFEFFSSMIRRFRVSVSDRYPVKLDKWIELGTFEARNSRDIQAFLVEHPQIYTKYIRIEFLTHYGNEYYCPVSLLRVHGTRMLDSWKEPEEETETIDAPMPEEAEKESVVEVEPAPEATRTSAGEEATYHVALVTEPGRSPWPFVFHLDLLLASCPANAQPSTTEPGEVHAPPGDAVISGSAAAPQATSAELPPNVDNARLAVRTAGPVSASQPSDASSSSRRMETEASSTPSQAASTAMDNLAANMTQTPSTRSDVADAPSSSPTVKTSQATQAGVKNKTSTISSAASASPTVQDSFFKAVTKRLQHLESNTTLSLKYIEDQSRFLQEALQKMEKKQISRVDSFLDNLNNTVLSELRNLRQQYDQIWQSTVIALETQREQSQREIVALSSRLNVLADEVVFQKRMAILQSMLLLACMFLVIFSRGLVGSTIDLGLHQGPATPAQTLPSPPPSAGDDGYSGSPSPVRNANGVLRNGNPSSRPVCLPRSASYNEKVLPLTPMSDYGRQGTPIIQVDEAAFFDDVSAFSPPVSKAAGAVPESVDIPAGTADEQIEPDVTEHEPEIPRPSFGRSALSQIGSTRKPLPALPEDPT